jgi:Holliday junction resolvase RusA-like endonuclease
MNVTIKGQTPAKKNSRRGVVRNGRIMNFPSKIYMAWEKEALYELKQNYKGQADKPVTIAYSFFVADNRKRDLDNMIASVNDCLVKAGLIKDDCWQYLSIGGANAEIDKKNPRVELWIEED